MAPQRGAETMGRPPACQHVQTPSKRQGFRQNSPFPAACYARTPPMTARLCIALLLLVALAACAPQAQPPVPTPTPPPVAVAPPPPPPLPVLGGEADFQTFIRDFETTAVAAGITPDTYTKAMAGIAPVT